MKYFAEDAPRARHWAGPALAGSAMLVWSYSFRTNETFPMILFTAGCIFGAWSLVNFVHHVAHALNEMKIEVLEAEYKISENHLADTVQKMNDTQIHALRMFGGQVLDIIPEEGGPIEMIFGVNVYLYFAWHMLVNSNDSYVKPISDFFKDTYHFDMLKNGEIDDVTQAREFTAWLVRYGFATHHLSNRSARWTSPDARRKAMERLGLTDDSYSKEYAEL